MTNQHDILIIVLFINNNFNNTRQNKMLDVDFVVCHEDNNHIKNMRCILWVTCDSEWVIVFSYVLD